MPASAALPLWHEAIRTQTYEVSSCGSLRPDALDPSIVWREPKFKQGAGTRDRVIERQPRITRTSMDSDCNGEDAL